MLIEEKRDRDKLLNEYCFICGLQRAMIEENGDFEIHRNEEHNPWNYIFFVRHLKEKNPREYSIIEKYVANENEKESHIWVPLKRAMCVRDKIILQD